MCIQIDVVFLDFLSLLLIILGLLPKCIPLSSKIPETAVSETQRWLFWFGLRCWRTCQAALGKEAAWSFSMSPWITLWDPLESIWQIHIYRSVIPPNYYSCYPLACITLGFNVSLCNMNPAAVNADGFVPHWGVLLMLSSSCYVLWLWYSALSWKPETSYSITLLLL